jgi:uncharacterized delta-60 repeat protein
VGDRADSAFDVAVQANGRIVAAGWEGVRLPATDRSNFALIRYLTGGRLDASFGGDGTVATTFGDRRCDSRIEAIVLQPDHRILAIGDSCRGFSMARYMPD